MVTDTNNYNLTSTWYMANDFFTTLLVTTYDWADEAQNNNKKI